MGTNVIATHGIDSESYVTCELLHYDEVDFRDIHLADLRTESDEDVEVIRRLSMVAQQKVMEDDN